MMCAAAVRSMLRTGVATTSSQQKLQLRRLSHARGPSAASQMHPRAAPLVSQAVLLDRFGKQQQYRELPIRELSHMSYWRTALVASGVCVASSLSEDSAAHAASSNASGGSGDKSGGDIFEELKQKLQALSSESLAGLQRLMPDDYKDFQTQLSSFLESGKGGQLSWGFAMGVCSGFALKKVSKVGALALGALFILMQCASYSGYIDVNYQKLERDVMDFFDINKDGQFDAKDVDAVYKQVMKVLEFSLPAGSGYAVGFLVGFRAG